ncbi:GNAT family N-acetyltransferase [Microbacterium hydrocarbonoxydans]|uniref:GNAT family N-acetyltransferase n=1 Tax=Microbacterium hydrocarbonoxydans TaxID=273678 RepID=UPI0007BB9C51|nr:GNAT family N-acetyltransferase [Microbacterium hydrocarbonoxydans]GAT74405.1 acetyltransferase, GNAT family protein [Microbacterium sp. HM58-2]
MTIALIRPTTDLFDSWAEAVAEFGGVHIDGSGMQAPVTPDRSTLDALIEKAELLADTSAALPEGSVHNDLYWIVDDGELLGFLSFRHELNEWLREAGGHIGYAVRPSRRRQGHASAALRLALARAREIGLDRVLVTCDDENVASARTIEGAGGVLQDVSDQSERGHAMLRRYWIETPAAA